MLVPMVGMVGPYWITAGYDLLVVGWVWLDEVRMRVSIGSTAEKTIG